MTTMTAVSPAEQLYALPESIQEKLLAIYRTAAGASQNEKGAGMVLLAAAGLEVLAALPDEAVPGTEMLALCGSILGDVHDRAGV